MARSVAGECTVCDPAYVAVSGGSREQGTKYWMNPIIDEIYETKIVRDSSGNEYALSAEIDSTEGDFLYRLISSDKSIMKTLEVGCAYGLSSLHICEAMRNRLGASHVIIDPKQMDVWHDIGVSNLNKAQIDFFKLIYEPSELALPDLLRSQPKSFDLIFIDGWHTFDQTMLDIFYANRLIRVGGYIVVDDCGWRSVSAAISYYLNYPAYERLREPAINTRTSRMRIAKVGRTLLPPRLAYGILPAGVYSRIYRRIQYPSMVAFKKIAEDARSWTWFKGF
jgi:predicted O-methyltransferase YrrM